MLSKKGEILSFIKQSDEPVRTKDITIKFGNGGHIWVSLNQLFIDGEISKPKMGYWE